MNKKLVKRAVSVVAAVAAVIIVTQLLKDPAPPEMEAAIRPVKTITLEETPASFRRVFPGRLEASQTVDLAFLMPGDLVELPIQEGSQLKEGDLIARLDARNAQSSLDAARADLILSESELARNKTLFDEELISAAEYELKQRAFEVALAAFNTAQKAVEDTEIRAPFDGVVARRSVENFQKVQAGEIVATFFNPSGFDVVIDIPESVVSLVPHYRAEFTAEFQQAPGRAFPLTVREFATVPDLYTKTYALTLSMNRPEDLLILPNMTVSANVDFIRSATLEDNHFLVPVSALVFDVDNDDSAVWIVDTDSMTVSPRTVSTDRTQGGDVIVTSGLTPGEIVVIAGATFLTPGQPVRLLEG